MNKGWTRLQITLTFFATIAILALAVLPVISIFFSPVKEIQEHLENVFSVAQSNEVGKATSEAEIGEINAKYQRLNEMIAVDKNGFTITLSPKAFALGAIDATKFMIFQLQVTERDELVTRMEAQEYDEANRSTDEAKLVDLNNKIAQFDEKNINEGSISVFLILFKGLIGLSTDVIMSTQIISSMMIMLVQIALLLGVYAFFPLRALFAALKTVRAIFVKCESCGDRFSLVNYHFFSLLKSLGVLIAAMVLYSVYLTFYGEILALVIGGIFVINFLISRAKKYGQGAKRYLNIEQACSIFAIAGAALFVFGVIKSGLIGHIVGVEMTTAISNKYGGMDSAGFANVSIALGALAVLIQLSCIGAIKAAVSYMARFSCMLDRECDIKRGKKNKVKNKSFGNGATGLIIMSLIIIVAAVAVMVMYGALTPNIGMLALALAGLIITLIARIVARGKGGVRKIPQLSTPEQRHAILAGFPIQANEDTSDTSSNDTPPANNPPPSNTAPANNTAQANNTAPTNNPPPSDVPLLTAPQNSQAQNTATNEASSQATAPAPHKVDVRDCYVPKSMAKEVSAAIAKTDNKKKKKKQRASINGMPQRKKMFVRKKKKESEQQDKQGQSH